MVNKKVVINDLKNLVKSIQLDTRTEIKDLEIKHGSFSSSKLIWDEKTGTN